MEICASWVHTILGGCVPDARVLRILTTDGKPPAQWNRFFESALAHNLVILKNFSLLYLVFCYWLAKVFIAFALYLNRRLPTSPPRHITSTRTRLPAFSFNLPSDTVSEMALFDRLSRRNLLGLLRVGFGARLRSEVADIFLAADADGILRRVDKRAGATVFFFQSGDTTIKPSVADDTLPQSAQCAVLAEGPSSASQSDLLFLSVSDNPTLSPTPTVVKVSLQSASNSRRILFSFASAGPHPKYLTLRGVGRDAAAKSTENVCKFATFHFEVLITTIGKGFVPDVSSASQLSYITPAQALTHALLQLNIRFRLCSVHNSVLASSASSSVDSKQSLTLLPQNVPSSTDLTPVVLSAFLLVQHAPGSLPSSRFYSLVVAGSTPTVSLHIPYPSSSDQDPTITQSPGRNPTICVNALSDDWGALSLGTCDVDPVSDAENRKNPERTSEEANKKNNQYVWLTARPQGKVETRSHRRNWEMFFVEFVEQSLTATWKDLPIPQLYSIADFQTRAVVRAIIQQNLLAASSSDSSKSAATAKSVNRASRNGAFNHAAALAGLSEEIKRPPQATPAPVQAQDTAEAPRAKGKAMVQKANSSKAAAAANTDTARSALPRNAANRKAARKNRGKNREPSKTNSKGSSTPTAAANMTSKSNSPSLPETPQTAGQSSENPGGTPNTEIPKGLDSNQAPTESHTGSGTCAACGRAIIGTSTTAMGKKFHPQCFCCGRCRRPIGAHSGQFRERGGVPYCQSCYASHLAARCARCAEPILETVITAMDKTWHKNCLTCTLCRLPLTQTFWLYADRPNEPRCSRCVTGEEYSSATRKNGRMVNLPGIGRNNNSRSPTLGAGANEAPLMLGDVPSDGGRARLYSPASLAPFRH